MARKRTRSSRRSFGSSAIARTRSSKSSRESSRLMYLGLAGEKTGADSGSGWAPTATKRTLAAADDALVSQWLRLSGGSAASHSRSPQGLTVGRFGLNLPPIARQARPKTGSGTWLTRVVEVLRPISLRAHRLAATQTSSGLPRQGLEPAAAEAHDT